MKQENILVTGATGFLGKYIIKELSQANYNIIASGRNIEQGEMLSSKNCKFIKADFTNIEEIEEIFKKEAIDKVIHAGALSSAWGKWEDFHSANVIGTENIAKLCIKYKVKRMVYISSPSVYTEKRDRLSITEDAVNENNRLNYYIATKIMSEKVLRKYNKKGLYSVVIRPRGLIGIGDPSIIPRLLRANEKIGIPLFNGGNNLVDITCVENVAYACHLALVKDGIKGMVFNITNDEPAAFTDILDQFFKVIGTPKKSFKVPFQIVYAIASITEGLYKLLHIKGEPVLTRYTVCTLRFSQTLNIEKAKELLGYKPIKSLKEGIRDYGEWWKANKKN